ncbi:hypothetical protein O181_055868 [Austropuccinia psidii MF-1]|uniref:Uncharacterized protein n=1 Tax=Austropuccinia psidii MF-1 TaxID=1389203 RepID=A0A9Q3E8L0_9BASI|nr:hypothetical protein [Austropuccinia psidii MF-1]
MSSKLTELTESSPSAPPPSVLCGSGIFSQLSSPSMASSGHFDPSQTHDSYKAVERPCRHTGVPTSNVRRYLWSRKDGPFGKELQFLGHLLLMELQGIPIVINLNTLIKIGTDILDVVTGSRQRINTEGVVRRIRRIADSPTDSDAEASDALDGEEVVVVPHSVDHQSRTFSSKPLVNRFQSQVIPSTLRTFQHLLASIPTSLPPASPSPSHTRPALNKAVRPSPNQPPRNSPISTSQKLQPMVSSSRRRDGLSPLPFLPLKSFKEEIVGLSKLPEKIQTRQFKAKKLWPGYSGELIKIAER